MAALKSTNTFPVLAPHQASRGRDNYNRLGVLRTKPGRADSPPALSMSCSDKMAKWSILGIQGSFGARFLEPVYISDVVIGEVPLALEVRCMVRTDCERALRGRVKDTKGLCHCESRMFINSDPHTRLTRGLYRSFARDTIYQLILRTLQNPTRHDRQDYRLM
jgi:hypothetical protein